MSAKERIGKLEALLARIRTNAAAPRVAAGGAGAPAVSVALPTVPPSAEAREKMRSESSEFEAPVPPAPPTPVAEEPLESRARLVAAEPAELIEEEVEVLELDERHIVSEEEIAVAAPATQEEEPPPSSRRPIAEPAETPQEAQLPVATAAPLTPPPESGKQVATEPLSFDDDFTTGVRESGARLQPPAEPSIPLAPLREPSPPPPRHELEAELPRHPPAVFTPDEADVEMVQGEATRPPPGPMPKVAETTKPAAPVHEVTRPTTPVAASEVASMVGSAPAFSPKTFGELLEASLGL